MPQHVPPRIYRRVPFETAVRLKFDRFQGFVEQYSANLSLGGMFIHTTEPPPVGTEVTVEFALEDGFELIRGRGRVTWVCEAGEGQTAGFGLRFLELTPGSRELIFRLVERRVREGDRVFDLEEEAPAAVAGRLVHDPEERLATPPWDRPAPRAGEAATAAGGATGPAPAPGDEVVRYGRAAREAAEIAAAADAVGAGAEESWAAGLGAAAAEANPEATAVGAPRTDPAAAAAAGTAVGAAGTAWAPGVEDGWPAPAVEARRTGEPAAVAGAPEGWLHGQAAHDAPEGASIDAPAVGDGWLVGEAVQEAPHGTSVAGAAAAAVVDDPTASFAGLVDDDEEDEDGAFGRAAALAEAPWTAAVGEAREAAASVEAGGAVAWHPPGVDQAPEWPPRSAGSAATGDGDDPTGGEGAAEIGGAAAIDRAGDAGRWGGETVAAAGETSPGAARWAWLEGEAAPESPPAAAELGAGEDLAAEPSGARPQRARRGGRIAAAIAAGVVVAALGGFLLFQALGADAPASRLAEEPAAVPATPAAGGDAVPAGDAAAAPEGAGSAAPTAAPDAPPPAAAAAVPPAADAPGPRSIERIAWERRGGGVDFEIAGSGPIPPARVDHFRVGGERPRLVVRIAGVERPYARGDVAVGGALVERVRTGFHPAAGGAPGSLHVVFDLAAADAAAAVDTVDGRVRVRFEER